MIRLVALASLLALACRPEVGNPNGYCRSDGNCAAGKRCEQGRCVAAAGADMAADMTAAIDMTGTPLGCDACGGPLPRCVAERCVCDGARETDTCLVDGGKVCVDGACAACTSNLQCPAGQCCAEGRCTGSYAWTPLDKDIVGAPPIARFNHSALWDAVGDRMLVFGGLAGDPMAYELLKLPDLWTLTFSGASPTWENHDPGPTPDARHGAAVAVDDTRHAFFVGGDFLHGMWATDVPQLDLAIPPTWTLKPTTGDPPARSAAGLAFAGDDRLILFGGLAADFKGEKVLNQGQMVDSGALSDVWSLRISTRTWSRIAVQNQGQPGMALEPRYYPSAVIDMTTRRLVVFGGSNSPHGNLSDAWALPIDDAMPAWIPLMPAGKATPTGQGQATAFDAAGRRLVVFGGRTSGANPPQTNKVFVLDLALNQWIDITPSGGPQVREHATAVFDPQRMRLLVFGGGNGDNSNAQPKTLFNDTWALSLPRCMP